MGTYGEGLVRWVGMGDISRDHQEKRWGTQLKAYCFQSSWRQEHLPPWIKANSMARISETVSRQLMEIWNRQVKLSRNSWRVHCFAKLWVPKRIQRKSHASEINDCILLITSLTCHWNCKMPHFPRAGAIYTSAISIIFNAIPSAGL